MMMRKQLRELKHRLPFKFIERRNALSQEESKEENEQKESPPSPNDTNTAPSSSTKHTIDDKLRPTPK